MSFNHLNETRLIGQLESMSDLIELGEHTKVVNFTVVTGHPSRDGSKETRHKCSAYNQAAEALLRYGKPNALIYVSGYLSYRQARDDFENGLVAEIRVSHAGDLKVLSAIPKTNRGPYGRVMSY